MLVLLFSFVDDRFLSLYLHSYSDIFLLLLLLLLLLLQVAADDYLTLELLPADQGGRLKVSLSVELDVYTAEAALDLADNRWHNVDVQFAAAAASSKDLQMKIDQEVVTVANASSRIESSPLFSVSRSGSVVIGQGFTGCLLQGPSVELVSSSSSSAYEQDQQQDHTGRKPLVGACPIPHDADCSK